MARRAPNRADEQAGSMPVEPGAGFRMLLPAPGASWGAEANSRSAGGRGLRMVLVARLSGWRRGKRTVLLVQENRAGRFCSLESWDVGLLEGRDHEKQDQGGSDTVSVFISILFTIGGESIQFIVFYFSSCSMPRHFFLLDKAVCTARRSTALKRMARDARMHRHRAMSTRHGYDHGCSMGPSCRYGSNV